MIARPCAGCGDVIATGSRCPDCRPSRADTPPRSHVAYANLGRWKALSKRLRRLSPFCQSCASVDQLQVDHIIPTSVAPELIYCEENCRIYCKRCNGQRQDNYTRAEALDVVAQLTEAFRRRPTRQTRDRLAAAEKAAADQGRHPEPAEAPTDGKAWRAMKRGADALR